MICEWFCQSEGDSDDETDGERKALRRVRMCSGLFGSVRARSSPGEQHGRWSSRPAALSLSAVVDCTAPAFCWGVLCVGVSTVVGRAPLQRQLGQRWRLGDPHPSPLPEGEGIGGRGLTRTHRVKANVISRMNLGALAPASSAGDRKGKGTERDSRRCLE